MENDKLMTHLKDAVEMVQHAVEYASEGLDPRDYILHKYSDYGFTDKGSSSYKVWMNIGAKSLLDGVDITDREKLARYFQSFQNDSASLSQSFGKLVQSIVDRIKTSNPQLAEELGYS